MSELNHIGLFAGIGGFELAARWMGWNTIAWSEWDPFCQKVLSYHFPEAKGYGDIKQADFTQYRGQCDILTGGFPCQPYSVAGKRLGKEDDRHLWPEMLRAIREIQPRWIVGENVRGLLSWNGGVVFEEVCSDLESEGYEVQAFIIPAAGVGAPHRRDRIWFIANNHSARLQETRTEQQTTRFEQYRELDGLTTNASDCRCGGRACEQCANGWSELFPRECKGSEMGGEATRCNRERFVDYSNLHNDKRKVGSINGEKGKIQKEHWQEYSTSREFSGTNISDATNTKNSRLKACFEGSRQEQFRRRDERVSFSEHWENFPTQPPVCGGDDGLPSELDGITFPKWRKESIKAYGNAIVPQVAYQIFKAIDLYD